jgi:hypothetical protein
LNQLNQREKPREKRVSEPALANGCGLHVRMDAA